MLKSNDVRREFWRLVLGGMLPRHAGVAVGASATSGVLWFRQAGGVIPRLGDLGDDEDQVEGRYLSLVERVEIYVSLREGLFAGPAELGGQPRVSAPQVIGTSSRLLFDVLAQVYENLGFSTVGDETFRDLVIARIVEPTSILDTGRVLADLGQKPASERTMRRTLARVRGRGYRGQVATACFNHAATSGDVSLCLYDVTNLLCRCRHNRVYADVPVMPTTGASSLAVR